MNYLSSRRTAPQTLAIPGCKVVIDQEEEREGCLYPVQLE
jgi:hypothetical protein